MAALSDLASIPISFEVNRVLEPSAQNRGIGGFCLSERELDAPYVKDYDAIDGGPKQWAPRFDLSNWGLILARLDGMPVAGAVIARDTAGIDMLEGRADLAVLWDIRVHPDWRRCGIGSALFRAAEEWARSKGCREIKIETQNINVAANRFYAKQGCLLGEMRRFAYPALPDEVQLLWYKQLQQRTTTAALIGEL